VVIVPAGTRDIVRMRIARRFRWGLIKSSPPAEQAFRSLLAERNASYIHQAIFLDERSFFIVDFLIKTPSRFAVEIDGEEHEKRPSRADRDFRKSLFFKKRNLTLVRFTNYQVLEEMDKVRTALAALLD